MVTGPDGTIFYYNDNNNTNSKVRQTEEYKKLKEKFDIEVKELKEKIEKKEKKEKVEGGNKSSQISPAVMLYNNKDFSNPVTVLNIENAVVTYKKEDFRTADQLALKSYVQAGNLAIANNNAISISIK
jgi:bla regulator protein BlaR1